MENLVFALSVTGPIFLMIIGGYLLKYKGIVRDSFIDDASRLVFHVALPALLFINIYSSDANPAQEIDLLVAGVLGTFVMLPLAWLLARPVSPMDRSAFIQGLFVEMWRLSALPGSKKPTEARVFPIPQGW
ncbi:AEC family transporter [Microbulbifer sp. MLAF003]|uniref:AEC family transporter n=1 Tax=Microbulbifer sp. MLAF003 TaxID=3032582 RepID=UPI0024AE3456|nr:AEC family transporter [Microbulbifer sp. MLAF003]WHI53116.1 AEC family transporter [Microbulbifer sp. MLAF003]